MAIDRDRGFTFVEMVVATGIFLTLVAAIFSVMNPVHGIFAAQLETLDMQQRLRAATDVLYEDLLTAGGRGYSGAPILPYRIGSVSPDPAGSFFTDRITVMYEPQASAQRVIADPLGNVPISTSTYWLKTDTVRATYQMMRYDGAQTDLPIADNVVRMSFEYYGEAAPPQLRPASVPAATYGPPPPLIGVDNAADTWAAGENCTFQVVEGAQVPRMTWLDHTSPRLVMLTEPQLKDGPWCPDSTAANRYDADLLRVRRVRVTLRVQAASKSLRGSAGELFTRGGTSSGGERFVPDQEITFDVTVRNLNLGR